MNVISHYGWWIFALILTLAELIAPGYCLLWIGMAAAGVGAIAFFLPELSFLTEAVIFVFLAIISCYCYWRFLRRVSGRPSDQPLLNRRAEQFIGKRYVLESAIVNGSGKVQVGDSPWLAEGPDLPIGATVEVIAVDGITLKVRAV
jgi:membrane protein implicated in regulation of membrane protease activity